MVHTEKKKETNLKKNWRMINWARRLEVPGVLFVTLAHPARCAFAAAAMATLAVGLLSHQDACFMPTPERYVLTPEIRSRRSWRGAHGRKPTGTVKRPFPVKMS